MNLRNIASIFKDNTKSGEKSSRLKAKSLRIDIFLIIVLFILVITPFVIILVNKISADIRLVNLFVSPRFEEIFGKEMTESILNEFNEANPDIRVRVFVEQTDRNAALKEPDIFVFDESDNIDLDGAILLVSFMDVLYYNIDILSAAGFDRPPRTLGQYQTYLNTAADLNFYSDSISAPENNRPLTRKMEDFAQGRAAMIIASTRAIPYLREKMGDEAFGITGVPSNDRTVGRYDINLTGIYAGIGEDNEYKDAAESFIEFLTGKQAVFCEIFKAVPGTIADFIPGDYVKDDPFYSKAWDIFEFNKTEGLQ